MGFKPGQTKPVGSGRKKGTINKNTEKFFEICQKHNHDPIEFSVLVAKNDWKAIGYESPTVTMFTKSGDSYEQDRITLQDRLSANNKLLEFMYPKRKAIEISSDDETKKTFGFAYPTGPMNGKAKSE